MVKFFPVKTSIQLYIDEKYRQIVAIIEQVTKEDEEVEQEKGSQELLEETPITSKKIMETIKKLEKQLEQEPKNRNLKKAKRQLEKDLLLCKQKYEHQKALFSESNSYSKTDPDATFMRMKDDPMKNGQLKPGYNVCRSGLKVNLLQGSAFIVELETPDTLFLILNCWRTP